MDVSQQRMNLARPGRNRSSADFQVCCIVGFQTRRPRAAARPADLEIGDTAGLETCATPRHSNTNRNQSLTKPMESRRNTDAFTMVEIALCLGVIAIALVAIIGVLPTGVRVQKDNREDTVINQEGLLWLEAIRSGAQGLDYLTNYVDTITISNSSPAVAVFASPEAQKNIPSAGLLTNG